MYRNGRLVIRLHEAERHAVEQLSRNWNLPVSTLARVLLLREAQEQGCWEAKHNNSTEKSKSAPVLADTGAFAGTNS